MMGRASTTAASLQGRLEDKGTGSRTVVAIGWNSWLHVLM
jgi:hypothetical protein